MVEDASWAPLYGIPAIGLFVTLLFLVGVWVARDRSTRDLALAAIGAGAWWALTGGLAASGLLSRFDLLPPPMALLFLAVFALGFGLGFSPLGRSFRDRVPLAALVLSQAFRLPLELCMHRAAEDGVMPVSMSYSGYNFEIVPAALALVVGGLILAGRAPMGLVWAWNLLGCATLAGIALIAFLASPMMRFFGDDPIFLNTWVTHFPFVVLPTICVVAAIAAHVVITRKLLLGDRPTS